MNKGDRFNNSTMILQLVPIVIPCFLQRLLKSNASSHHLPHQTIAHIYHIVNIALEAERLICCAHSRNYMHTGKTHISLSRWLTDELKLLWDLCRGCPRPPPRWYLLQFQLFSFFLVFFLFYLLFVLWEEGNFSTIRNGTKPLFTFFRCPLVVFGLVKNMVVSTHLAS